jgi:translation elongation factor EF-Tu-like GTPase
MEKPVEFAAEDYVEIKGRGTIYTGRLDRETHDFAHLLGKKVLINGVESEVIGIERYAHMPPFRKGEAIGLFVKGPVDAKILPPKPE